MKKLNVKLTKGGKEYKASLAVCKGIPIDDFLSLLRTALPIPESVPIDFKDSEGLLLIPYIVCNHADLLRDDDYEVILREKPTTTQSDEQFSHIISEIRIKNRLNDEEYFSLRTWMRENHQMISQIYQNYLVKHDHEGFIEWLLKSSGTRMHVSSNNEFKNKVRPRENPRLPDERPATSRTGDRPKTSNQERKGYQKYIQIMSEMEAQGLLEQNDVRIIKALILRENFGVMREFDQYFLHNISLNDLGNKLKKLADKLSLYMERPSSPMPKNNQLQFLVETFARESLISPDDIEILKKLITEENEFVLSAFDVYESDKDQSELVDSLMRAINKKKKFNEESVRDSSFCSGSLNFLVSNRFQ